MAKIPKTYTIKNLGEKESRSLEFPFEEIAKMIYNTPSEGLVASTLAHLLYNEKDKAELNDEQFKFLKVWVEQSPLAPIHKDGIREALK